ncbi:MAG: Alpha-L-Rha alpha-1,3-L-rhamnosyltransferase (EC [uncultured Sulfurovum sp.]|uniref:Alpha-L-Rha alpha-1,3-L-rhamnosyltransferase (EC) n=1 Tax=uncultured Sulfurovum sp. TaxID=269237 RepID=A0A6S6TZE6_9BACT|nr:MAG: Alpha-L-Rha alpha-1,3-L-rhamnosyltransferase (EC [uncultured Sulfurovum sp.]
MNSPKITILIATYNGELYIREQLNSILNQSFTDFKITIRDDNSDDTTWITLKEFKHKYTDKIELFQNKNQLGVVKNFEKLISGSTTEYIALSDQDDIWHKDKLLKSFNALERENHKTPLLFHSDLKVINNDKRELYNSFFKMRFYTFPKKRSIDIMLGRSGVMGNTIVFNYALKEKILPFPKDLVVHDYWIALVNEFFGKRITSTERLVDYRIHESNVSNSIKNINKKKKFQNMIKLDFTLPYHKISRELVLDEFLLRFNIKKEEKDLINYFKNYLLFNQKNRFYFISLVFRYEFFRDSFIYKVRLIIAIIFKK